MFSIVELQTNGGQTTHLYSTAPTKDQAMSKFHQVLASAAISNVEIHTCIVLDEHAKTVAVESYNHEVEV